jgi:hypothetical protein
VAQNDHCRPSEESFLEALSELEVGAIFASAGWRVSFGPSIGGLTPDLLVEEPASGARLLIEIWTRSIPELANGQMRAWADLQARIAREIPISCTLLLYNPGTAAARAPDSRHQKVITKELRDALVAGVLTGGAVVTAGDYQFVVTGCAEDHAVLVPLRPFAQTDSRLVVNEINKKVNKYGGLVLYEQMPFMVVVAAEPNSGCDEQLVSGTLQGANSMSMALNMDVVGLVGGSRPVKLRIENSPPQFNRALSAVAWLRSGSSTPGSLIVWRQSAALKELPVLRGGSFQVN